MSTLLPWSSFALLLITGCASIIEGTTQRVTVRSNPTGASATIIDLHSGLVVAGGTTPFSINLERGTGFFEGAKYEVVVEKEGFSKASLPIRASVNGWYIFGNFFFGGLIGWVAVDPASGAMWSLNPDNAQIELVPVRAITIPRADDQPVPQMSR